METGHRQFRRSWALWASLSGSALSVVTMFVHDLSEADEPWFWALVLVMAISATVLTVELRRLVRFNRRHRLLGELASKVNRAVLMNTDPKAIFGTILDDAFRILKQVDHGSVLTFVEPDVLAVAASRGFEDVSLDSFRLPLLETWQYQQTHGNINDALIIDPNIIRASHYVGDTMGWADRSVMSAPIFVGNELYGLINIDSRGSHAFHEEDLEVMRWFRAQIEVGLHARLHFESSIADLKMDGLTRVLSRAAFEESLTSALKQAAADGRSLTLGMFDVDGLKQVNDAQGHQAGDTLLRIIADTLRGATRASDLLGRYGGDEFIGLFHRTDAATMVTRTRRLLSELGERSISFSFGFAQFPDDGSTLEELIAVADRLLYQMKLAR